MSYIGFSPANRNFPIAYLGNILDIDNMSSLKKIYHADLIRDCAAYCERAGIKETTFGQKVLKDRLFLSRLRDGKTCRPQTEERVREFLAQADQSGEAAA